MSSASDEERSVGTVVTAMPGRQAGHSVPSEYDEKSSQPGFTRGRLEGIRRHAPGFFNTVNPYYDPRELLQFDQPRQDATAYMAGMTTTEVEPMTTTVIGTEPSIQKNRRSPKAHNSRHSEPMDTMVSAGEYSPAMSAPAPEQVLNAGIFEVSLAELQAMLGSPSAHDIHRTDFNAPTAPASSDEIWFDRPESEVAKWLTDGVEPELETRTAPFLGTASVAKGVQAFSRAHEDLRSLRAENTDPESDHALTTRWFLKLNECQGALESLAPALESLDGPASVWCRERADEVGFHQERVSREIFGRKFGSGSAKGHEPGSGPISRHGHETVHDRKPAQEDIGGETEYDALTTNDRIDKLNNGIVSLLTGNSKWCTWARHQDRGPDYMAFDHFRQRLVAWRGQTEGSTCPSEPQQRDLARVLGGISTYLDVFRQKAEKENPELASWLGDQHDAVDQRLQSLRTALYTISGDTERDRASEGGQSVGLQSFTVKTCCPGHEAYKVQSSRVSTVGGPVPEASQLFAGGGLVSPAIGPDSSGGGKGKQPAYALDQDETTLHQTEMPSPQTAQHTAGFQGAASSLHHPSPPCQIDISNDSLRDSRRKLVEWLKTFDPYQGLQDTVGPPDNKARVKDETVDFLAARRELSKLAAEEADDMEKATEFSERLKDCRDSLAILNGLVSLRDKKPCAWTSTLSTQLAQKSKEYDRLLANQNPGD